MSRLKYDRKREVFFLLPLGEIERGFDRDES